MDRLWAPWRLAYVANPSKPAESAGECFLCRGLSEAADRENLILARTKENVAILNRFPYNNGHILIAPNVHKARLDELSEAEILDGQRLVARLIRVLEKTMKPEGFNVGLNLGKPAGAGLPGHLHWHIVPRWNGDNNFMPVLADVRVIVQSLDAAWELLTAGLAETP